MSYLITRHIPNFVDVPRIPEDTASADTLEQLLSIPWIKQWYTAKNFFRFSLSKPDLLMVELDNGHTWYVVGTFEGNTPETLPKWVSK